MKAALKYCYYCAAFWISNMFTFVSDLLLSEEKCKQTSSLLWNLFVTRLRGAFHVSTPNYLLTIILFRLDAFLNFYFNNVKIIVRDDFPSRLGLLGLNKARLY